MRYALSHLADGVLLSRLFTLVARGCELIADMVAHIAEVDARRLYRPAGYPSMHAYCIGHLHMSEDAACKRITAARAARRCPAIFDALADGRLHLAGVVTLAPHLTDANAGELLAAATHRTRAEIERLIRERFPQPAVPARITPLAPAPTGASAGATLAAASASAPADVASHEKLSAPGRVGELSGPAPAATNGLAPGAAPPIVATPAQAPAMRPRVAPLSAEHYALQLTLERSTVELLRRAQDLLGHRDPGGDIGQVLHEALALYVGQLEQRKFAATSQPRRARASQNPRHIPAAVKRAVWERDGGRCTFVSEVGHRCEARRFLEFDHATEVARGGEAAVSNVRLRCRAHNQYTAERTFGAGFMETKRRQSAARLQSKGPTGAAPAVRRGTG